MGYSADDEKGTRQKDEYAQGKRGVDKQQHGKVEQYCKRICNKAFDGRQGGEFDFLSVIDGTGDDVATFLEREVADGQSQDFVEDPTAEIAD